MNNKYVDDLKQKQALKEKDKNKNNEQTHKIDKTKLKYTCYLPSADIKAIQNRRTNKTLLEFNIAYKGERSWWQMSTIRATLSVAENIWWISVIDDNARTQQIVITSYNFDQEVMLMEAPDTHEYDVQLKGVYDDVRKEVDETYNFIETKGNELRKTGYANNKDSIKKLLYFESLMSEMVREFVPQRKSFVENLIEKENEYHNLKIIPKIDYLNPKFTYEEIVNNTEIFGIDMKEHVENTIKEITEYEKKVEETSSINIDEQDKINSKKYRLISNLVSHKNQFDNLEVTDQQALENKTQLKIEILEMNEKLRVMDGTFKANVHWICEYINEQLKKM